MNDLGFTQSSLAKAIQVPQSRISEITRGVRGITAPTDLRLVGILGFPRVSGYAFKILMT